MPLSYKDVADLLKIIDASACEEVILEVEGLRLVVRRGGSAGGRAVSQSGLPSSSSAAVSEQRPVQEQAAGRSTTISAAAPADQGLLQVRAPMIGTFYRRPSPKDQPFVEVGQRITEGDPLGLIEVMKLYTTIAAPVSGTVEQIAAGDGALVEFDDLLFLIRAD